MSDHRLPDGSVPVLLSSDSAEGLRAEARAILTYLREHPDTTPQDLSRTLFRTRIARPHRALIMAEDHELSAALRSIADGEEHPDVVRSRRPASARTIGFVFPGQGSQQAGMGAVYYRHSPEYRSVVDEYAALHEERYGNRGPVHYLLGDREGHEPTLLDLHPARMFHMLGLAAMWQAVGVRPAATIGHSQGELAACVTAGMAIARDAATIAARRAELLERFTSRGYAVAVLGTDREEGEALLARHSGWAEVAVINSPRLLAVSGEAETIDDLVVAAAEQGRFAKRIRMSYPAHTSAIVEIRAELEKILEVELTTDRLTAGVLPCFGATLGARVPADCPHSRYWYWNLRNRVRFDRAVMAAAETVDTFIEISEHPTLQLAIQQTLAETESGVGGFHIAGTARREAANLSEFTRAVAELAVLDLNFSWDALRTPDTDGPPASILRDFPPTVMNSRRLWAGYPLGHEQSGPARDTRDEPAPTVAGAVEPVLLAEQWSPLAGRTLAEPRTVLPIGDIDADLDAALRTRARRYGAMVLEDSPEAVAQADTFVVLLPTTPSADDTEAVTEFAEFAETVRRLPTGPAGRAECWLVTTGAEAVLPTDLPALGHAGASAVFRSVALDHFGVAFRHLDLPAEAGEWEPQRVADLVLEAVHVAAAEPELAVREGKWHAKRLAPRMPATPRPHRDEVVILGGTGQVGLHFCEYFVRAGARRVTLVNRTGRTARVADRLDAIRALGDTDIEVLACDITDDAAVGALAARYGPDGPDGVDIVVHAAVDYVWSELNPQAARDAAASKVLGIAAVMRELPLAPDAVIMLCSSFAATLGGRGQELYAGANRMIDALAVRLRAAGHDCVAVQWGLWELPDDADPAAHARITGAGLLPLPPAAAISTALAGGRENHLVLSCDWPRLRETVTAVGLGTVFAPALDRPEAAAPAGTPEPTRAATGADTGADLAQILRREIDRVMLTDDATEFDGSVPLVALGFDSLLALELRTRVKAELDREVPVAEILSGASLDDVVRLMTNHQA